MLETPFWKRAAASLPSGVREQYALQLQGAERFERRLGRTLSGLAGLKAGITRWLGGPALKPRSQG
jgi:hypothetical protein